jgi:pilus assembly protein TadC
MFDKKNREVIEGRVFDELEKKVSDTDKSNYSKKKSKLFESKSSKGNKGSKKDGKKKNSYSDEKNKKLSESKINSDYTESFDKFQNVNSLSLKIRDLNERLVLLFDEKLDAKNKINLIYKNYISGLYGYTEYSDKLDFILKGAKESEYFDSLNKTIYGLLNQFNNLNDEFFKLMYSFEPVVDLKIPVVERKSDFSDVGFNKKNDVDLKIRSDIDVSEDKVKKDLEFLKKSNKKAEPQSVFKKDSKVIIKKEPVLKENNVKIKIKKLNKDEWSESADVDDKKKSKEQNKFSKFLSKKTKYNPKSDEIIFSKEVDSTTMSKQEKDLMKSGHNPFVSFYDSFIEKVNVIALKIPFSDKLFLKKFIDKHKSKDDVVSDKTLMSKRFKELRNIKMGTDEKPSYDLGLMSEQVKSDLLKSSQKSKKPVMSYDVSSFGALANILVKDISIELINSFPDFFKKMYHSLRLANISILSNTYTNIMVLSTLISFVLGSLFSLLVMLSGGLLFFPSLINSLVFGFISGSVVFFGFYSYPKYMIKQRERDIKTNFPFVLDNMSAVISSGVSPSAMFKMIVSSKEYGEISKEIEKIVEYIDLFGYDLVTAVNTVAQLSPSKDLKEFFDGFVSTVESGGDLVSYLRERATALMLQYKLERQNYTESIATFSDVYTGIMVASPLFFVAALSLISVMGGDIGGFSIDFLMVMGTYVVIPLINVLFLVFIELTQPNV